MQCERIWRNARLLTLDPGRSGLGEVEDGIVASRNGQIVYAGPSAAAPELQAPDTVDCEGRWITPGLVDPHTHLVYAGDRAHEFELRLAGASYEEITRAGGGIVSTVAATRAASEAELVSLALPRLDALLAEGVTHRRGQVGLRARPSRRSCSMLRAARALAEARPVDVRRPSSAPTPCRRSTAGDPDGYIDDVVRAA